MPCLVVVVALMGTSHPWPAKALTQAAPADASITASDYLQPAELAHLLESPARERPLILHVGSHVLYAEAHIPGSEYVGAGGEGAGLQALRNRVKTLKRDRPVVIYCGCCPMANCPNIRPAFQQLVALGFIRIKVLNIADNFGTNWVAQGYPVAKGR